MSDNNHQSAPLPPQWTDAEARKITAVCGKVARVIEREQVDYPMCAEVLQRIVATFLLKCDDPLAATSTFNTIVTNFITERLYADAVKYALTEKEPKHDIH